MLHFVESSIPINGTGGGSGLFARVHVGNDMNVADESTDKTDFH